MQSLLPAANLLQLGDVRDACCEFLQSQLHPTNCLGIRWLHEVFVDSTHLTAWHVLLQSICWPPWLFGSSLVCWLIHRATLYRGIKWSCIARCFGWFLSDQDFYRFSSVMNFMVLGLSRLLLWLPATPSLFQMRKRWRFCFFSSNIYLAKKYLGVWKRYCLDPALSGSSCSTPTLPYGAHQTASAEPRLSHPQGFCLRMRLPTLAILWLLLTGWQWAFAEAEWQLQGLHNWGHEVPPSQGSHEKVQSWHSNTLNAISPSVFHIWCAFGFREIWSLQWPWHLPEQSQGNLLACQRWKKHWGMFWEWAFANHRWCSLLVVRLQRLLGSCSRGIIPNLYMILRLLK